MEELIEAQRSIIGSILVDPEHCLPKLYGILEPEHFTYLKLRKTYKAILYLYGTGTPITSVTVADVIDDPRDEFLELLKECSDTIVTSTQITFYADILIRNWKERRFREILKGPKGKDLSEQVTDVINNLDDLMANKKSNIKSLEEVFFENRDSFFAPKPEGMNTGINFVDNLIGWIEDTDLVCIAARPAVGKSAFAMQIALNIAVSGKKVQYYSMEMSNVQVLQRIVAKLGKIDFKRVRMADKFIGDEVLRFQEAEDQIRNISGKFNICDESGKTVGQIRNECKYIEDLGVIIVDYLQLMKPEKNYQNRATEVGTISRGLKQLASELHVPIIILSQLNRASEGRQGKEPNMADLRESGDIEQDCNTILMLWNKNDDDLSIKGLKVEKARQGQTGKGTLKFDGMHMKFYETEYKKPKGFIPVDEPTPFDN